MKIAIGSDHGGFHLKEVVKDFLAGQGHEVMDFGTNSPDSCDYPDFAAKVAKEVAAGRYERGVLICGTGIGVSIVANKVRGIRAALCGDVFSARASREHNDANILCLGERVTGAGHALLIVEEWLKAEFAGGRHLRRVEKIKGIERREESGQNVSD